MKTQQKSNTATEETKIVSLFNYPAVRAPQDLYDAWNGFIKILNASKHEKSLEVPVEKL